MSTLTPWEQKQRDVDVENTRQREYNGDLYNLRQLCPPSMILDEAHLHAVLRLGSGANRHELVARCFLVRGLLTSGRDRLWIADVLKVTPEDVDRLERGPQRWTPPAEVLASFGARLREVYGGGAPPTP